MLLRGFQVTEDFSCVMGTWQLPPASGKGLTHTATELSSQTSQLRQHLPRGAVLGGLSL